MIEETEIWIGEGGAEVSIDQLSIESAVFQALGKATVCWDTLMGAGVFHSDRVKEIGDQLLTRIKQEVAGGD